MVDLVLDGVVCEQCGALLGDGAGYPRKCKSCEDTQDQNKRVGEEEVEEESFFG
jgi:hypothetical protein